MTFENDLDYHRSREQQCRALAADAADPTVRRKHEELADMHAGRAALLAAPSAGDCDEGVSLA